ncbi:hypothetical protein DSECCO2_172180 [anaerobic digester metagenome]
MAVFYDGLNKVFKGVADFLDCYSRSEILQNYFFEGFESFAYSNLINKFFLEVKDRDDLDEVLGDKIELFRLESGKVQQEIKLGLFFSLKEAQIHEDYYTSFRDDFKAEFPGLAETMEMVEAGVDKNHLKRYLHQKRREIKNTGKLDHNFDLFMLTTALEAYALEGMGTPHEMAENITGIMEIVSMQDVVESSEDLFKSMERRSRTIIRDQRRIQETFEDSLYKRWREPLDLLESLIRISMEAGEVHANKILSCEENKSPKNDAIIRIHARSLQIASEVLVLLKSGYADGANARWRSLHELAVTAFFLFENDEEVSKRYMDYVAIEKFKEAREYKNQCEKLGYPPLDEQKFEKLKMEKERLCELYDDNFHWSYGWIPSDILPKRSFKDLEEYVNLNTLRPFYKFSSASIHGSPRGLYRLGLMDDYQEKVLLCGTSDYGLADPLETTAISLFYATLCLLNLEPDYESIFQLQLMKSFVDRIRPLAVEIQRELENMSHYKPWI